MDVRLKNQNRWLSLSLVLSLSLLWISCFNQPGSVQELFPELVFDESARTKQFAVTATGSEKLIDDLEDGDLNGIKADGRNWSWSQFDDMTDGIQYLTIQEEKGDGNKALYIKGGGWQKTGAGVSAQLVYKTSPRGWGYYDASVFSGIEFRVKGSGPEALVVSLGSPETTSVYDGGVCPEPTPGHFKTEVTLSDSWTTYQISYDEFLLRNGQRVLAADPAKLKGIHFAFETQGDYEIWLDDLRFF